MQESPILTLNKVYKNYGVNILLQDVSFSLQKGQITTLIGQNGIGKTTIARIMLGLERCDQGSVIITPGIKIGYVPQKLDFDFNMPMTATKLIEAISDSKYDILPEATQLIPEFSKIKNSDISKISAGQLQKLLLLGSIISKPDLLILDEPIQYLDINSQQLFYSIISRLKTEYNMTIFMISHDLFTVMKKSDQVICINKHICCSGKPQDIETNLDFRDALSEIGLYIHQHDHEH
ncbi:MAG: ATP-binding cassette domain-containing protein [Rickettsiaceae bacterium]|nr:ATP-binding cassette domain-containing protein [Rickettsiaceae bacterium]